MFFAPAPDPDDAKMGQTFPDEVVDVDHERLEPPERRGTLWLRLGKRVFVMLSILLKNDNLMVKIEKNTSSIIKTIRFEAKYLPKKLQNSERLAPSNSS